MAVQQRHPVNITVAAITHSEAEESQTCVKSVRCCSGARLLDARLSYIATVTGTTKTFCWNCGECVAFSPPLICILSKTIYSTALRPAIFFYEPTLIKGRRKKGAKRERGRGEGGEMGGE